MHEGRRVVCVTPSGRRRYLALLARRDDLREWTGRAQALLSEADARSDGTDRDWPPKPKGLRDRWRWFRRRLRRTPPRFTLTLGPGF